MRRLVVGTAGHIDHGKTALVRALTGIDTDRLQQEKERGITIELGFAHLDLGDGLVAGVVDVPGHERFVKSMAAGAGGIDLALLVVAADEGVMPQTREHVDILRLLGIRAGVVALTKSDLLPDLGADWLPLVHADLDEVTAGTFLERAPRVTVSSRTGEGLDRLLAALRTAAAGIPDRPADGPLYLPVDRAFSIRGFGTVVTGTLLSGAVAPEDVVALVPGGRSGLRVRGVQVHGAKVERALAGQRTAVNLPGVEPAEVRRGMVLAEQGRLPPSPMLDVELSLLDSAPAPLAQRAKLLLHVGTAQVPATVVLLDRGELLPGETAPAQLRLAAPVAALPGQRFILRGFAAVAGRGKTVAGGRVLAIAPRKHRPSRTEDAAGLAALRDGDATARVSRVLADAGARGLDLQELEVRTALSGRALARALELLGAKGGAILWDRERKAYVAASILDRLVEKAAAAVRTHHQENPLAPGLPREELRERLGLSDPKLFARVVASLAEKRDIESEGEVLRERGRRAGGGDADRELLDQVRTILAGSGLTPPDVGELARRTGEPPARVLAAVRLLEKEGEAVRVTAELYFDAAAVAGLRERLVAFLRERGEITTQEFKELVAATRKWVIPLGEYFDREKVTLRVGDARRVLRGGEAR
jgi:selenocysteine-specific elongation factor